MFSFTTITAVALSALSAVNGLVIPRGSAPSTYNEGYLEKYTVYHARYLALGCENKHNTTFFDQCCHPLLATETLTANRLAQCNVNAASGSQASATPTPTADPDGDGDCEDGGDQDVSSTPVPTPTPSPTQAPNNVAPSPSITPASSSSKSSSSHSSGHSSSKATPTPSKAAPAAAAPSPSKSSSSGSGQTFDGGFATFYTQGGQAGACGDFHSDSDLIAAIDQDRYGDSSKQSSLCGQKVHITNTNNGKTVTVTIADDCPTCTNSNSIDLSVGAFTQIATEEEGMVPIKWYFE